MMIRREPEALSASCCGNQVLPQYEPLALLAEGFFVSGPHTMNLQAIAAGAMVQLTLTESWC